jgi:hypothetical protein
LIGKELPTDYSRWTRCQQHDGQPGRHDAENAPTHIGST